MNKIKQFAKLIFMFIFQNDKLGKMYVEWGCKVTGSKVHDDNYINWINEIYNPENKVEVNPNIDFIEKMKEFSESNHEEYEEMTKNISKGTMFLLGLTPKGSFLDRLNKYDSEQDIENILTDLSYKELT